MCAEIPSDKARDEPISTICEGRPGNSVAQNTISPKNTLSALKTTTMLKYAECVSADDCLGRNRILGLSSCSTTSVGHTGRYNACGVGELMHSHFLST